MSWKHTGTCRIEEEVDDHPMKVSGGGATSSTALIGARSEGLKSKILQALGIMANTSTQATVIRS
jgi:hypothetical protein